MSISTRLLETLTLLALLTTLMVSTPLHAQQHESALSDAEVEKLRDAAATPPDRVAVFIGFLDDRAKEIQKQTVGPRRPGREEDIHDLMEQFTSVADDLEDNLDDYGPRHPDLRKVLPKLVAATERWSTILKSPPDNEAYNVTRKLALESLNDIREQANQMIAEQKEWFTKHPASKEPAHTGNPEDHS